LSPTHERSRSSVARPGGSSSGGGGATSFIAIGPGRIEYRRFDASPQRLDLNTVIASDLQSIETSLFSFRFCFTRYSIDDAL